MGMSSKYPFSMIWTGYTDEELLKAAFMSLGEFDRADVLELVKELARRYTDVLGELDDLRCRT